MSGKKDDKLKCSFCGKTQDQVTRLIAGPGVYICDQCVELCSEIMEDEMTQKAEHRPIQIRWRRSDLLPPA